MAQVDKKRARKSKLKAKLKSQPYFTDTNYKIFGAGILVLILGYLSLMKGPVDSFWSLTLAPILLLIGYLVIIPYAILYKKSPKTEQPKTNVQ